MFKNATLYLTQGLPDTADQFGQRLAAQLFTPCSATQIKSSGWAPPRGDEHGALVESIGGQWIARFMIEAKAVPSSEVRKHADAAADKIEAQRGCRPGKREMRDLREDALQALLPRAFARETAIRVWIDPQNGLLVLDSASQSKADEAITGLVRVAGQGFGVSLLQTNTAPQSAMSAWLTDDDNVPECFAIERECELKGTGDEPARVRLDHIDLNRANVRRRISEGMRPVQLALSWQGRVGFTLAESLKLKKIRFDEGVFGDNRTPEEDRFDADTAIATGELTGLISDLIEALGGRPDPLSNSQDSAGTKRLING
jgi:recombination associated protein RdgC